MNECVFCISNDLIKVPIVSQDKQWLLLDMQPLEGSTALLAVTKRHIQTPFDLTQEEWHDLQGVIVKAKRLLDEREPADGYNIGWNVHQTGGQTVQHAHLHIVARYSDELLAGKGIRYHFKPSRNKRKPPQ